MHVAPPPPNTFAPKPDSGFANSPPNISEYAIVYECKRTVNDRYN